MLQSMGSQTVRHDLVTELHDDICSLHGRKEFRYIAVVHFKGFCYFPLYTHTHIHKIRSKQTNTGECSQFLLLLK